MDDLTPKAFEIIPSKDKIFPADETLAEGFQKAELGTETIEKVTYTFYAHTITAGTGQGIPGTIVIDRACAIQSVYLHLEVGPGVAKTLTIDVHKNGTTIFGNQANRPSITGVDVIATSGSPSITTLNENDELTMDIDENSGSPANLSVYVRCRV